MPYIFRVIKVGQKADAPHGARLNTTWKNDKQKQIFEAVEDCILAKKGDGPPAWRWGWKLSGSRNPSMKQMEKERVNAGPCGAVSCISIHGACSIQWNFRHAAER